MSEREVNPASTDMPISTGEFRARPDVSASTAEFRAFATGPGAEAESPWAMRAPGRSVAKLAGIVVGAAAILIIIAILVLNL